MDKKSVALFLMILVLIVPTVEAFSFGEVIDSIGDFFKGIFGKGDVAESILVDCECVIGANCDPGYSCKSEGIICNAPEMSEFNGLCVEEIPTPTHILTAYPSEGPSPLSVHFTVSPKTQPGQGITGDATAPSAEGITYEWHFEEGVTQSTTTNEVNYTYEIDGIYQASVIVKQNGVQIGFSDEIEINVYSMANIIISPESLDFEEVYVGSSLSKDITITNNGEEDWFINNVVISNPEITLSNETFNLKQYSSYILTVTFSPISSGLVEGEFKSYVYPDERLFDYSYQGYGLEVSNSEYLLTADPYSGGVPLTVDFTVVEDTGNPITNITNYSAPDNPSASYYEWYFGNGNNITTTSNEHTYTYGVVGGYDVNVIVTQNGLVIGESNPITIEVTSAPSGPGGGGGSGGGGSGSGGGSGGDDCGTQWSCTYWGSCSENVQTRTCTDFNNCGITEGKPLEIQSCVPTLADQLGISNIGKNLGGEIQEFASEGGKLKSTSIALILLFILIIISALFIYFRGPFRKKKLTAKKPDIKNTVVKAAITPELNQVINAVRKAKNDGFTRGEIFKELESKGWEANQIQKILDNIF
ncbi:MAG: PKD domain-containing protein [Nanoarchaeota archaeon]|nr:PKD domain-containing protein [Nanoarchaeota archaeon]